MDQIDLLGQMKPKKEDRLSPSHGQESPLYRDIAAQLRDRITSGDLPVGALMPTEMELADANSVSRNTIRQAYAMLVAEGLITTGRGRGGRRVRNRRRLTLHASQSESRNRLDERCVTGVDAWVADVTEVGRTPSQTIHTAIENASTMVSQRLELPDGAAVGVRRRLRTVDGDVHNLNVSYYPLEIVEGTPIMRPDDVTPGVIALMREMGYEQVRFKDELEWRMPTPDEQEVLEIPVGIPLLLQIRTAYTAERPVRVTITTWPGDRARLVYELPA